MKMKLFLPIIFFFLLSACEIVNPAEETPAFIRIDQMNTNAIGSSNINDAWFYFDTELQGSYELPAIFPVLRSGEQDVLVAAGIKKNGITESRDKYPFYKWHTESITLTPGDTTIITPTIVYDTAPVFSEDFENLNGHQFDTLSNSDILPFYVLEGGNNYLKTILIQNEEKMSIVSPSMSLPLQSEIYLEIDYKSNSDFLVGLMSYYPEYALPEVTNVIKPKADWNKIYIDFKDYAASKINNGAISFSIWIAMDKDTTLSQSELSLDNIKLLHEE